MDIQKIPAIQQKRIVTFVNHFIIDTVTLLNKFINSSENTLWKLEKRMRKLETTLKLLEVKLSFVPEMEEESASTAETSNNPEENDMSTVHEQKVESVMNSEEGSLSAETGQKQIPEVKKYAKMIQVGVPIEAVKMKMQLEGLDPNLLG